ncbi:unnamed protein product [Parascedosporium putredinis]|uniref:Alpha/beta hydrolase fold-3 domain-containing protein n=1 Tax=Parascedosporium putredinis TaxID=1442378 RepID=A0A9P1M9B8_9PEZI|nr:unnamed protein product [Parascedosporium putredinis]CAI7991729.1 unnamed protein product [Parascedosporium putredinis]
MLTLTTCVYARPAGLDIECDVYEDDDYPVASPVVLFFHSGGLVGGSRKRLGPWIVQACKQRKWTLISADYRFLPQAKATDLLEDVAAAYTFARNWKAPILHGDPRSPPPPPPPLALFGITPITTFQHPFFSSSILLTPEPLTPEFMGSTLDPHGPILHHLENGPTPSTRTGSPRRHQNPHYVTPVEMPLDHPRCFHRGTPLRGKPWPPTVLIHGDDDYDVSMDVSVHMAQSLGEDRIKLLLAERQGHLFESESFLEDDGEGAEAMAVVRRRWIAWPPSSRAPRREAISRRQKCQQTLAYPAMLPLSLSSHYS